jgi:hypothetical protein
MAAGSLGAGTLTIQSHRRANEIQRFGESWPLASFSFRLSIRSRLFTCSDSGLTVFSAVFPAWFPGLKWYVPGLFSPGIFFWILIVRHRHFPTGLVPRRGSRNQHRERGCYHDERHNAVRAQERSWTAVAGTCHRAQSFGDMVGLAPSPGNDWTDVERAEIGRLEALCRNTENWELDCSHTDAGDPWCIVYDRHEHRVVLHIARIDRRYVVVWPPRQRSVIRATIEPAVDIALSELESTCRRSLSRRA